MAIVSVAVVVTKGGRCMSFGQNRGGVHLQRRADDVSGPSGVAAMAVHHEPRPGRGGRDGGGLCGTPGIEGCVGARALVECERCGGESIEVREPSGEESLCENREVAWRVFGERLGVGEH